MRPLGCVDVKPPAVDTSYYQYVRCMYIPCTLYEYVLDYIPFSIMYIVYICVDLDVDVDVRV